MSCIIRATVLTNSSDDSYCRVKLSSDGVWEESALVESVNGIPLKKGDIVFVDISNGSEEPLILGRAMSKDNRFNTEVNGSVLYESSNGSRWTIAQVENGKLIIENSDRTKIAIDGSSVTIEATNLDIKPSSGTGTLTVNGVVEPTGTGPFCCLTNCAFTGAPHVGQKITTQ